MRSEEEIRKMVEDIKKDIPKYTNNPYMYDRLQIRLEILKCVLQEDDPWAK